MNKISKIKIFSIFLVFLLLYGCSSGIADNKGPYKVKNVIDGDTIELSNGSRVRYIGVNAPETMKRVSGKWVFSPQPYSVEAKKYNLKSVFNKTVSLEFDVERKDKYGRILAYVFQEKGEMINADLIKEGLATVYTFYPNIKYYDLFNELQQSAIRDKRGIWSQLHSISFEKAVDNIGNFCIVEGRVSEIFVKRGSILLIFSKENTIGFTAKIPLRNLPLFKNKGIDPFTYYLNKKVYVTGKVMIGPSMYIDNPSQIRND